jgi:two-component sensor histidine kinase
MRMFIKVFIVAAVLTIVAPNGYGQSERKAIDSLQKLLSVQQPNFEKARMLNALSKQYISVNLDSCLLVAREARIIAEKNNLKTAGAAASLNISNYWSLKGNYTEALTHGLTSLNEYDALKDGKGAGNALLNLAQIYKNMSGQERTNEYLDKGIGYGSQSYNRFAAVADTAGMIYSLNMKGILYRDKAILQKEKRFYHTAFAAYMQALSWVNSTGKATSYYGKLYNNISQVYLEDRKDYHTALEYLFKAVAYNLENNKPISLTYNYGNISNVYTEMKRYPEAFDYAHRMLAVANQIQQPSRVHDAYRQLYKIHQGSGRPDSALQYYILADAINDSLTGLAKTAQVMDLQTKYETAQKELKIHELNNENAVKNKRIIALFSVLLVFIALAVSLALLYRRVQQQKKLLAAQSKRLELMMKELHHRVKNNLQIVSSLLSLQTYKLKDEGTVSVLRESQQRVQAMSLIHQRLYKKDELTSVNLKEYITDLIESLLSTYGYDKDDFNLQIRIEHEMMDIDKALPIGLIVNELVTNVFKYAYAAIPNPSLLVSLSEKDNEWHLSVKDNGIGIDEAYWKQKKDSFGKQLVSALCRQLRAKQELIVDDGTEFILTIPKKAA